MKLFSSSTHGVIDYLYALMALALPALLRWNGSPAVALTAIGFSVLCYSLVTRYELGVVEVLPLRMHLKLDMVVGALAILFALVGWGSMSASQIGVFLAFGVAALAVSLTTQTESAAISDGYTAGAS